jgi:hypothetical protein
MLLINAFLSISLFCPFWVAYFSVETEENDKIESKRNRRSIDLEEKLRIVEEATKNRSNHWLAHEFNHQDLRSYEYWKNETIQSRLLKEEEMKNTKFESAEIEHIGKRASEFDGTSEKREQTVTGDLLKVSFSVFLPVG